jgi:hypothetical protein
MEGLEWIYRYYTGDCVDWQWKYDYLYPPLFRDLSVYVPRMNVELEKDRAAPRDVVRVAVCDELIRIRKYHPQRHRRGAE